MEIKYPIPPFTDEKVNQKVQLAEDAWNSKDPKKVSEAYTIDTEWRNREKFINGRQSVVNFLTTKWKNERHHKLKKELWAYGENKIAVRFEYEYQNKEGQWFRAFGNENWEFNENGLMAKRYASINDVYINKNDRKLK